MIYPLYTTVYNGEEDVTIRHTRNYTLKYNNGYNITDADGVKKKNFVKLIRLLILRSASRRLCYTDSSYRVLIS